jgi:hypothetical protein
VEGGEGDATTSGRWRSGRGHNGSIDSNHFVGLDNLTKNIVSFLGNFSPFLLHVFLFTVLFF